MLAYRGDLAAAEAELRAALKAEPGYLPAHLILGDVLFKSGRPEEAKAEYEATLARYPDQPQAMFGAGPGSSCRTAVMMRRSRP